ncbi:caspase family protein [Streptomyces sp. NPDC006265]|uniref:caspase family protein n=1 Tax=Streptomyces sp. NPDC006265 TaxID=3156740 RepID=UPI0033BD3B61
MPDMDPDRAVVLIGVHKAVDLPELEAVDHGLHHMETWARGQGIPDHRIKVFSDTSGDVVRLAEVSEAVQSFADLISLEQLIVYFCGHGVLVNGNEYWLLSRAPQNPNEAVNIWLSWMMARKCGVGHVTLISDACRTASSGGSSLDVYSGSSLFENRPRRTDWVDVFFACRPGESSYEIADPLVSSREYRAVYTEVLAKALGGDYSEVLEQVRQDSRVFQLVRPYPLKEQLPGYVGRQITELGAQMAANQFPDGWITSHPKKAWLSRLPAIEAPDAAVLAHEVESEREVTPPVDPAYDEAMRAANDLVTPPPDPGKIESSAIQVTGNSIKAIYTDGAKAEHVASDVVQIEVDAAQRASSILLHLESGHCVVIPALLGRVATAVFRQDQLVDVSYAPLSEGTRGRREPLDATYVDRRAWIAAASRYGLTWWEGYTPDDLMGLFAKHGEADPSLAIYLAYGLASLGQRDLVGKLLTRDNLEAGNAFYDVMLLSEDWGRPVLPFTPLLARGWALVGPLTGDEVPEVPAPQTSHWTLFTDADLPRLLSLL